MIRIQKHPNFSNWFNIFSFGKLVEQVNCEIKALQIAKQCSHSTKTPVLDLQKWEAKNNAKLARIS